jgi:hypothetical protein
MHLKSIEALEGLMRQITDSVEIASVRGLADGPFLFVRNNGRSVEVSTNDQQWWVEVWEVSEDDDASPVDEFVYRREEDVLEKLREWLRLRSG